MPKKKPTKRQEDVSLTVQDRFYIEQHGETSQEDLARILNKPIEVIRDYVLKLAKDYDKKKKSRVSELMDRPGKRKGIIAMTEAASMVSDDSSRKYVTLEAINRAIAEGDQELVRELKNRYEEQQRQNREVIRTIYSDKIHYIQKPDDDAEVF